MYNKWIFSKQTFFYKNGRCEVEKSTIWISCEERKIEKLIMFGTSKYAKILIDMCVLAISINYCTLEPR